MLELPSLADMDLVASKNGILRVHYGKEKMTIRWGDSPFKQTHI